MNDVTVPVTKGFVIHDAICFILFRSEGFACKSGQGVDLAIDTSSVHEQSRPFTPTPTVKENPDYR